MDLWNKDSEEYNIQINKMISKKHFLTVNKHFYISEQNLNIRTPKIDMNYKDKKFKELFHFLNQKFIDSYPFIKFVSLDDSISISKKRAPLRRYIATKRHRIWLKFLLYVQHKKNMHIS